ncbi:hypothetical protein ACQEU3_24960 [Spirillospora sp. CA-253888]
MSRAEISAPDLDPDRTHEPGRSRSRTVVAVLAAAGCLAVLGAAALRLTGELTRDPTAAERADAQAAEVAARYRTWPAGRLFPATLPYTLDMGSAEQASRIGIDPATRCDAAVDPQLSGSLTSRGCLAVLRATYLDQLQGLAVTVGVVVFPDERAAREAVPWFPVPGPRPGLRTLPFEGSPAARFGDTARQAAAVRRRGPYLVAATVGYADGRPAIGARQQQNDLAALGPQLADAVLKPLAAPGRVECGAPEWTC